jgi:hypothetical protein
MAYVPPHLRTHLRKKAVVAPPKDAKRGVRFIGNATGDTDIVGNTGARYSPHTHANQLRKTLKNTKRITPNAAPVAAPTTAIREMPLKFKKMIREHLKAHTHKKQKKQKKYTRRIHK